MQSRTKRALTAAELDDLLRRALGAGVASSAELSDGFANAVWRLVLDDGREVVLKLSPPPELEQLRYERNLLRAEAMVYRRACLPGPELLCAGFDDPVLGGDYLIMSALDGVAWNRAPEAPAGVLRRELGGHLARLHTVTGDVYGYPHAQLTGPTWRSAFLAMTGAVLDDAARYSIGLPVPAGSVRAAVEAAAWALDEVTVPALVHFDVWPGNVFLTPGSLNGGPARIQAIIDHERAFWGDPLADFVTPTIFGELEEDDEIVAGYREAGGVVPFDERARVRMALYRLYLCLVLLAENGPRQYPEEEYAPLRDLSAAALVRALDLVRPAAR
ncbi:phosphotransferase family protein [Planomonospora venezuelensis]|uniref:Aminoglycoside phosphotransferase (APT) family kinase protein n=1 Tax=Planomonospora venezuelensis TaxID=1999 RepID=A0A841D6Q0_PLAVE|nr:aminoglycoside phosphotransferase family protein [Planomonospora venezuelensis]MBB5964184.1 aminoglycoside phosphotransferase (APT) family kinase protein [Planomonospora venezuelensis]GIN05344.1 phosphotransferase [Planomonospora venezuelensis]